jgi:UDP-glucose 4-epimerase
METAEFKGYDVFNLGTGTGSSVLEVIHAFENSTGEKLNYIIGPRRAGDIEQVWGDVAKSKKVLKWQTELDLDTMLQSAWEWEKYIAANPLS